jgi:NAD(P)-dependent dehydrogenase (short-subunit alcohol dehydrogenase family)
VRYPGIEELTPEIWDRFFAIFVRAPVMLTRAALPLMRNSGFGRIVNNTTSYRTMLRVLPYGPAKAALESMSAVWAKELEASAITVIVPGGPRWPREKMLRPANRLARFGRFGRLQWTADHGSALGCGAFARRGRQAREPCHRVAGVAYR